MRLYELSHGGWARFWDEEVISIHKTRDGVGVTLSNGWQSVHLKYWDTLVEIIKKGTTPALTTTPEV